ncbi:ParA family protein [Rhodothermus marinus]|uniref:ParA family protein n=1 Tax=Rhodothermus marinus (strain ATCC 43812 / DSM 4252 / R-10) TaxID=518766 RepID=D0MKS2_RHOM4|nr:ParA family protein [Rhodothermus marinus]ACY49736.1 hypothetical protein Rmar_2871 [Rhodothermus marinus DSM 4252]AEN74705.1 hypothetical protein Rhom172_2822 [Rhodothermus marinus SG0.5JP17-172]
MVITVAGIKGGSGKTPLAFFAGWFLDALLEVDVGWVDLDYASGSLTERVERRRKHGFASPGLLLSASYTSDEVELGRQFAELVKSRGDQLLVVDTAPGPSATALLAVEMADIVLVPTWYRMVFMADALNYTLELVRRYRDQLASVRKKLFLVPMGKSSGAVISRAEQEAEEMLKNTELAPAEVLPALPYMPGIEIYYHEGLYPTEGAETPYQVEQARRFHDAIKLTMLPVVESLAQLINT